MSRRPAGHPGTQPARELIAGDIEFARADMPLLARVLAALRGQATAMSLPDGYFEPADAELLPHRAAWQFELPPPEFLTAVARLRRLVTACPDAEITQTEDPWMWTATIPPVSRPGGREARGCKGVAGGQRTGRPAAVYQARGQCTSADPGRGACRRPGGAA